eukprot:TRINITY_DN2473_c0_g1_i1.p1 TRINITY_DN2473_c0_g1~~TRINITY_DN2473_c0_g1_i1.p1  ORF type:complete len:129 (-),score=31.52 TRINITY_DN2473_c0_g1_i1:197-583(-)
MANDNEFCIYGGRTGDYPGCESLNDIACANLTVFGIDFERDVEGELELSCDANGLHLCLNYTGNFTLDYWSGLAGPFEIGNGFEEECFNTTVIDDELCFDIDFDDCNTTAEAVNGLIQYKNVLTGMQN